jgi:hypothetical protein
MYIKDQDGGAHRLCNRRKSEEKGHMKLDNKMGERKKFIKEEKLRNNFIYLFFF